MSNDNEALRARNRAHRGLSAPSIGSGHRAAFDAERDAIDRQAKGSRQRNAERGASSAPRPGDGRLLLLVLTVGAVVGGAVFAAVYGWDHLQRQGLPSASAIGSWVRGATDRHIAHTAVPPLTVHGLQLGVSTAQDAERLFSARGEKVLKRITTPETAIETTGGPPDDGPALLGRRYVFTVEGRLEGIREARRAHADAGQFFDRRAQEYASRYETKASQPTLRVYQAPGARIELSLLDGNRVFESVQRAVD